MKLVCSCRCCDAILFVHRLPIADIFLDRRRRRRKRETAADNSTDVDLYDYDYSYDEDDDVNSDAAATSFEDYYDTIGVDYSEGKYYLTALFSFSVKIRHFYNLMTLRC